MPAIVSGYKVDRPKLQKPFRLIVGGGSGCGKSYWVKELVEQNLFSSTFDKIILNYPEYLSESPLYFDDVNVEYRAGLIDEEYIATIPKNSLIILDDLMTEIGDSKAILKLMSVAARKRNISVILITQNVYQQGKQFRNIRLNATGFVLFKFHAGTDVNKRLIKDLGFKESVPDRILKSIYSERYGYIFLNVHPERHYDFGACRSNIFEKYISIFNNMEYIAIPKSDFLKYFKVIEDKKNSLKAIKNEIAFRKRKNRKRPKKYQESDSSEEEETKWKHSRSESSSEESDSEIE